MASTDSRPSLTYKIPVLCIQVGQFDNTGNLISTPNRAAELTTIAYENARQSVLDDWFLGLITNDVQAASAFVTDFRFELLSQFSSTTLSTGNCDGSIPESRPYYNVFGICLPVIY